MTSKLGMLAIACAIGWAGAAWNSYAADAEQAAAPIEPPSTRQACVAAGSAGRTECEQEARLAGGRPYLQCEEANSLQQRRCMLDVLERSRQ